MSHDPRRDHYREILLIALTTLAGLLTFVLVLAGYLIGTRP